VPRFSFQTKLFLAALSTALLALLVAGALFAFTMQRQTNQRVEQTLRSEAPLAAELLARAPDTSSNSIRPALSTSKQTALERSSPPASPSSRRMVSCSATLPSLTRRSARWRITRRGLK
jgi:hypothetical protein